MAEAILNHKGHLDVVAYSAGRQPTGSVRREALRQLEAAQLPITGFRSKS
jgi:protein-tyrosine-phosphatase